MSTIVINNDYDNMKTNLPHFLDVEKNISRNDLIRRITETSDQFNTYSVLSGRAFLVIPTVLTSNEVIHVKTIKEVDFMEDNIKIKGLYNLTIGCLVLFILISILLLITNVFNIPIEVLGSIIIFSFVGVITFSIDAINFNKQLKRNYSI